MKKRTMNLNVITGLFLSSLTALPSAAVANNQISDGINKSGAPALVIDNIVCKGNETTDCDFITKKYYQQLGDVLDPNEIADAKLRLGTLIQFRDVDIHLEKGHQRGHVIVVFDIVEASNIQYELGAGLSHGNQDASPAHCSDFAQGGSICSNRTGHANNFGLNATVTDFNFLGFGKRLSVGISASHFDANTSEDYLIQGETGSSIQALSSTSSGQGNGYNFNVEYYDPHLFDSSHYYLKTDLTRYANSNDSKTSSFYQDRPEQNYASNQRSRVMSWNFELGRRFGSHSFVALRTNRSFDGRNYFTHDANDNQVVVDSPGNTNWGITYGWDSQNDTLFPTQGSVFTTGYNHSSSNGNRDSLGFNYLQHFSWQDKTVLSLGGSMTASSAKYRGFEQTISNSNVDSSLSARITRINPIDRTNGVYSGWHTEINLRNSNKQDDRTRSVGLNLQAGYTHQTDSMIYRFTLGYYSQEKI